MRRSKPQKDIVSSIPKMNVAHRRSSSIDCASRRGSYQPTNRRTSSAERQKVPGSAIKPTRSSPRGSICSLFPIHRGSLVERKHVIKDNRPLSDKAYQKQCIQTLVNYLEEANFPFSISRSALMMPQMKDFENIFQFLFQKFDPSYQVKKIDEEAPKLLKMFGYPFALSKSSFRTITRMSWPQLLGALMWLMDLCKVSDSVKLTSMAIDSEFEDSEGQSILLNYVLQSYRAEFSDPQKEIEIFESLVARKAAVDFDTEDMKDKVAELQLEINKKTKEQIEYNNLIEYRKGVARDIENLKEYISKMSTHMNHKLEILENVKMQQAEKERECEKLQHLVAEKEKIYKAQGFDGQQAQNFYSLRKGKMLQKLNMKVEDVKVKEQECWGLKIEISEIGDKLDSLCQDFNLTWEELRGAIKTALTSLGALAIPAAVKLYKESKLVLPDIHITPNNYMEVKQVLDKVKKHIEDLQMSIQNIISVQNNHISEVEMYISDLAVKQKVSLALLEQKQQELEIVTSDGEKEVEAMRLKCNASQKKLKDIRTEQLKMDQLTIELRKSVEELKVKLQDLKSNSVKGGAVAEGCCQKTFELVQDTCTEINAEKQKLEKKLKELSKLMQESSLATM